MAARFCKLEQYCPTADLFSLYHTRETAFLDSSLTSKYGNYSIIGLYSYLKAEETDGILKVNGTVQKESLLDFLNQYLKEHKEENPTDLPMLGGAIGYLSYDYGRSFEQIPSRHKKEISMPDAMFEFFDLYLIEDLKKKELYLSTSEHFHTLEEYKTEIMQDILTLTSKNVTVDSCLCNVRIKSDFVKQDYLNAIDSMIDYIKAGDIYIANMTRQISVESSRTPYEVFRYLREHNPSPFGSYFNQPEFQIVSASPERFLEVRDHKVETRPIKGTRKRGITPEEDLMLKEELSQSEKDKSELLMIVDLERNDLNRVCRPGSVKVTELFEVETYATVFHLVSTIVGELETDKTVPDLIASTFPGGSITGAPKIRAMEIIDELEHSQRGLYTGSIGYLSLNGDCDLNIVIRTAVHQNGIYHLGVGGGITAESELEFEYDETWQKAKAVVAAIAGGDVHE